MNLENKSLLRQAEDYTELVEAEEPLVEQKEARGESLIQFLRDRFHKVFLAGSLLAAASGCISSVRPPKTFSTWKPDYQTEFAKREDKKLIVTGRINAGYLQVLAVHKGKVFNVQRIVEREMENVEIESSGLGLELGLAGGSFAFGGLFIAKGNSPSDEAKPEKEEGYFDTEDSKKTTRKGMSARGNFVTGGLLLGAGLIMSGHSLYTAIKAKDSETMTTNMRNKDTVTSTRDEVFAAPNQPIHLQSGGNQFLLGHTSQRGGFQIPMSELHRVVDLSLVLVACNNIQIVVGDASAIGEVSFEIPLENFAQAIVPKEEWDLYKKSRRGDMESAFRYLALYPKGYMFKEVQSYADAVAKARHKIELSSQAEERNSYQEAREELKAAKAILDYLKDKFQQDGTVFPTELAELATNVRHGFNRIEAKEHPPTPSLNAGSFIRGLIMLTGALGTELEKAAPGILTNPVDQDALDEADEERRANEERRQEKSMAKKERAMRAENEKLKKKLQKGKDKSECDHLCKRNYQDRCGKGLHTLLPLPVRGNTPAECNNLYKGCLNSCYHKFK